MLQINIFKFLDIYCSWKLLKFKKIFLQLENSICMCYVYQGSGVLRSQISRLHALRGHEVKRLVSGYDHSSSRTPYRNLPGPCSSEPRENALSVRSPAQDVVRRATQRLGQTLSTRTTLQCRRYRPCCRVHVQEPTAADNADEKTCAHEGHRRQRVHDYAV